jgi:hypothetical protein
MNEVIAGVALHHDVAGLFSLPEPNRHYNVIGMMYEEGLGHLVSESIQGFTTSHGRFVDRKEGLNIALYSGQVKNESRSCPDLKDLYSEDLW